MATAYLEKVSYLPRERLRVAFSLEPEEVPCCAVENLSTDILRIDVARNNQVIGFGVPPERAGNDFMVEVELPETAAPGLYAVARSLITARMGSEEQLVKSGLSRRSSRSGGRLLHVRYLSF